ncbi:MAG: hypothetical protein DU481_05205 [Nitrosomonas sp.]
MYPEWLKNDINELLNKVDSAVLHSQNADELSVTYLRCWAVIELFTKVTHTMLEKREYAEEIKNKISTTKDSLEKSLLEFNMREAELEKIVSYYFNKDVIPSEIPKKVKLSDLSTKISDIDCQKKFSFEKAAISTNKRLPSKSDATKMVEKLHIKSRQFLGLLKDDGKSQSKYYITRNHIAHEGKLDISPDTLIKDRIMPVLNAALEIRDEIT